MLNDPTKVPTPAANFIVDLSGQQDELCAANWSQDLEMVTGHCTSPFADWLPEESKQCEFHVLKPPAGMQYCPYHLSLLFFG